MTALSPAQIDQFIHNGYVLVKNAFSKATAAAARDILWKDTGCDPDDPSTWTRPVIRLGEYAQPPFRESANTPVLLAAYDQLAGQGNWAPRGSVGSFPVRFPSGEAPGDDGWHVDASFAGEDPTDYFGARVNVRSRQRALLMLFLYSDVSETDAPTRLREGSHLDVARILQPFGPAGLSFMELAQRLDETAYRPQALATGEAGDVYLCHPFLAHAAQAHRGKTPKFMAQPALLARGEFDPWREDGAASPVEKAIRLGIG
ncbi:phytanoyl-CoA dioxygenase family protein [Chitinophaga lutea]